MGITELKTVEYIGTFENWDKLENVTFEEGSQLGSIGDYAFWNCNNLQNITIPNTVTSIESGAFVGCSGLTEIKVNGGNKNYSSENGVLFNKGKTTLICCPAGKTGTYTIPNSVTSIGECAFSGCSSLTSVKFGDNSQLRSIWNYAFSGCNKLQNITIPDNVTGIGNYAFENCQTLRSIILLKNVSSIGEYVFAGCGALQSVYYTGTKEEWDKISIGSDNDELKNAKLYCECKNPKYLTLKKIWKDGGDRSKRGIPQFILYKNGVAIQTTDYRMDACLYEDINDVFGIGSNGKKKITEGARGVDTWVYKFIVYDYDDKAKYAVEEEPMEGYKSEAFKKAGS